VAAVWRFSVNVPGGVAARWMVGALLIAIPYVLLGRACETRITKRTYRYADEEDVESLKALNH
jgi:hypothetical protein